MKFNLVPFIEDEKEILREILFHYLKEIEPQEIGNTALPDFSYQYLDLYWQEESRIPLKIQSDTQILGFVLINDFIVYQAYNADRSIAEFYIKPSFRLKNVGKYVAFQIFDTYRGKWEVRQRKNNHSAHKFWKKIIEEYTQNSFEEVTVAEETIQLFHS